MCGRIQRLCPLTPPVIVPFLTLIEQSDTAAKPPKYLDKFVFSDYITTKIVPAQYGDASGVRGAAWLWNDEKCN